MPKRINRIGQTFGNLKILDQKIENRTNYSFCKCALCGGEKWIRTDYVVAEKVKSCGCIRKEASKRIGETYGGLIVREITREKGNTKAICECTKCKKMRKYILSWLIENKPTNCGCEQIADIKGKRFGFLEPIKPTEKREGGSVIWECKCHNCNKICYVSHAAMTQRGRESCGCYAHIQQSENGKKNFEKSIGKGIIDGTNVLNLINDKPYKTSKTGIRGVSLQHGRYVAKITFKGETYYLGRFMYLEDAEKVRKKAEKEIFGNFLEWYAKELPEQWERLKKKEDAERNQKDC